MSELGLLAIAIFISLALIPFTSSYSQTRDQSYLHAGQWVKYGPVALDIKSDNNYLKLLAKAILSRSMQVPISPTENTSLLDFEWFLMNISKIEGNDVHISVSAKPKFSENVLNRTIVSPLVSDTSNSNIFSIYLDKVPKIGDKYYTDFAGAPFPLNVNRTIDKYIGTHLVPGFEIVGTRNSYQDTDGTASETTIKFFYGMQSGLPLEIRLSIEIGSPIFGTINAIAKITAIDVAGKEDKNPSTSTLPAMNICRT